MRVGAGGAAPTLIGFRRYSCLMSGPVPPRHSGSPRDPATNSRSAGGPRDRRCHICYIVRKRAHVPALAWARAKAGRRSGIPGIPLAEIDTAAFSVKSTRLSCAAATFAYASDALLPRRIARTNRDNFPGPRSSLSWPRLRRPTTAGRGKFSLARIRTVDAEIGYTRSELRISLACLRHARTSSRVIPG